MMRIAPSKSLFFVFLSLFMQTTYAVEILKWHKKPLKVALTVDHERVIFFDNDIKVGVARSAASVMRIQSNAGAVYLKANSEFEPKRLQVKDLATGQTIILDVSATKSKKYPLTEDIKVVYPSDEVKKNQSEQVADISPIDAIRYVAQRFYAPKRLWVEDVRISKVPIANQQLDFFFKGKSFGLTTQTVQASWKTGKYFTTAIKISSTTNQPVKFDYSDINYDFEYAVFQHLGLEQAGSAGDTTMLYLITWIPFNSSLHPWLPKSDNKDS